MHVQHASTPFPVSLPSPSPSLDPIKIRFIVEAPESGSRAYRGFSSIHVDLNTLEIGLSEGRKIRRGVIDW